MITISKINPPTLEVFTPDGKLLGVVNEYEFLDLRVQIKKAQEFGYSFIFNNQKFLIDKNGELEDYPKGLLDTMTNFYLQLL